MTADKAKSIVKKLGLKHKEFSLMLGHNVNYVTEFKRHGVSQHMSIILDLCDALLELGYAKAEIIEILSRNSKKES